jgi:superfamily II DNA or RNA helicase
VSETRRVPEGTAPDAEHPPASRPTSHGRPAERLAAARARIARTRADTATTDTLGEIVLRPHQRDAARRVHALLRYEGGCLVADEVGSGKSYVALAIASSWSRPLLVVPAALRSTWDDSLRRARMSCPIVTHEALSRGALPSGDFDGLVVDESHRFRPTSRRHAALARLAAGTPVLLLSATPMQNRARELAAQIALFLGEVAYRLEPRALARWVVRSARAAVTGLPRVAAPRWLDVPADDAEVLRAILALPPPPRAADAGDGGVLVLLSLVRAWASSRAALVSTLRRRRRTLVALEQCLESGRRPTRGELASWRAGDDVQLGFAPLLAADRVSAPDAASLAAAVVAERDALEGVADALARTPDPDVARAVALRRLRGTHSGRAVLAFGEFASTVRAYHAALRADAEVGLLTAREARIASGRLPRDALLARFAPRARGVPPPSSRERVTLLLATDLLSEGVNLQDASVVVHLDLPWNPARLAQRLGRVRRPGGAAEVSSFLVAPPARAALLLRVESRLREKLARAGRTIGPSLDVLPRLSPWGADMPPPRAGPAVAAAELRGEIEARLADWRSGAMRTVRGGERECVVAAVRADVAGWLACLDDGRLVAELEDAAGPRVASDDDATVARALALAEGPPRTVIDAEAASATCALAGWLARDRALSAAGVDHELPPLRRSLLQRVDAIVRTAPRHRRADVTVIAGRVRRALAEPLPLGLERALAALAEERDAEWLEPAAELLAKVPRIDARSSSPAAGVVALILLGD